MSDYNLILQEKRPYFKYSGHNQEIGLSFVGTEENILKANFIFTPGQKRQAATQISEVLKALMPHDFKNNDSFKTKLLVELNKLQKNQD